MLKFEGNTIQESDYLGIRSSIILSGLWTQSWLCGDAIFPEFYLTSGDPAMPNSVILLDRVSALLDLVITDYC